MRRVRQPGLVVPLELRLEGAHDGLSMALRGRQIFGKLSHLQKICIRDGALVIIQKALGSLPETKEGAEPILGMRKSQVGAREDIGGFVRSVTEARRRRPIGRWQYWSG